MHRPSTLAVCAMSLVACSCAPPPPGPAEITVYAAASLQDVMETLAPLAEAEIRVRPLYQFAGSNVLARQIEAAGKADVFLSADEAWMDRLEEAGLLDAPSRVSLLSNRLVVLVPGDRPLAITCAADLAGPGVKRLALADPESVPAGRYARSWLERAGAWESVRERVVPTLDVRAALGAVESGAVDAAIVYRTDVALARTSRAAYEVPEADAPPISYAAAALAERPSRDVARRFVAWLATDRPAARFRSAGFVVRTRVVP